MKRLYMRMDADIDKSIEELKSLEHMKRKMPEVPIYHDLLMVVAKHKIGDYTKTPDNITAWYLLDSLKAMSKAFHNFIGAVNYQRKHGKQKPLKLKKIDFSKKIDCVINKKGFC